MEHVGLIGHCLRLSLWQVWAERKRSGAERAKTWVERSGAVGGSQKNCAKRERGAAERERSGERRSEKSGLMRSGKTFRSVPLTCSADQATAAIRLHSRSRPLPATSPWVRERSSLVQFKWPDKKLWFYSLWSFGVAIIRSWHDVTIIDHSNDPTSTALTNFCTQHKTAFNMLVLWLLPRQGYFRANQFNLN